MQRGFRRFLKQKQIESGERHTRPKVSSRVSGRAGVLNKRSKNSSSNAKRTPEEIIAGLKRSRAARTIQHRLRGPLNPDPNPNPNPDPNP